MADNNNKPQTGSLTGNSLIIVALIATGASFFYREAPLQASRPTLSEAWLYSYSCGRKIAARLWQDPFNAVGGALSDETQKPADRDESPESAPLGDLKETTGALVLGVMVSGSHYFEDVEFRRRLRYAVLSGLGKSHFRPDDSDHIHHFKLILPPEKAPVTVPYEVFNSDEVSTSSLRKIFIFWLDENAFSDAPKRRLSILCSSLQKNFGNLCSVRLAVLGPHRSDTLLNLMNETTEEPAPVLRFYSYGATASEKILAEKVKARFDPTKARCLQPDGIDLIRTTAADDALAHVVFEELQRRGLATGDRRHIAIVSEWDSLYGRT